MRILNLTTAVLLINVFSVSLVSPPGYTQNIPIPSTWEGQITGQVYNQPFNLPVVIVLDQPIYQEHNPLHLMLASDPADVMGSLMLISALSIQTGSGNVTLQYLSVQAQGNQISATLNEQHIQEGAAANMFEGPCVSDGVGAVGCLIPVEPYLLSVGTTTIININGNQLMGRIQGTGNSVMGMSDVFNIPYQAEFNAVRVK